MSVFQELLFLQGYVTNNALLARGEERPPARAPAAEPQRPAARVRLQVAGGGAAAGCG
jgi:hypothetical protein